MSARAVVIACPTWRVECSAAWNNSPSVVDGMPARPTRRSSSSASSSSTQLIQMRVDDLDSPRPRCLQGLRADRLAALRGASHLLRVAERLASCVCEETIERTSRVPNVESDWTPRRPASARHALPALARPGSRCPPRNLQSACTTGISSGGNPSTRPRSPHFGSSDWCSAVHGEHLTLGFGLGETRGLILGPVI